jgi:hypothetical protein
VRSNTCLIDLEGQAVHRWPVGTNPRLLDNGDLLDATGGDVNGVTGLKELDWDGNLVWQFTKTRTGYAPHHVCAGLLIRVLQHRAKEALRPHPRPTCSLRACFLSASGESTCQFP